MARLKIATVREFCAAMEAIPSLRARLEELRQVNPEEYAEVKTNSYRTWYVYLAGCEAAIAASDWDALAACFSLSEGVDRAKKSEMAESSYVAFVEDLKLPQDRRTLNHVLAAMGPRLQEAIARDRQIVIPRLHSRSPRG